MKTASRITSLLTAVGVAGAGLMLAPGAAMAAPAGGFPADWQPFTPAALQQLASLGVQPVYTGSRTFSLEKTGSADVVVSGWSFAVEEGTFPALPAGSAVDVMYPAALSTYGGSIPMNSVAHASYYEGGTRTDGGTSMTWLVDNTLSPVPAQQLAAAGLKTHNPSTYSDCVVDACGITVAPAQFVAADPGDWDDYDHMLTTGPSVFIPVSYAPVAGNGVEYTDWDARDVAWSAEPGKVTGVYSGVFTAEDGTQYVAEYTATVNGGISAAAPWYPSAWSGALVWNPCGDVTDPSRQCLGLGQSGALLSGEIASLNTLVGFEIGDEIVPPVVPPVTPPVTPPGTTPPVTTPPAVSTPETPQVSTPAIPGRVESGAYLESTPGSYWVALVGVLVALGTAVGGLMMRRRRQGDAA